MKLTKTRVLTPLAALAFAVAAQGGDLVPNEGFETFNVGDSVTNVNNFTFQEGADQAGDLSTVQAYAVGEALPETTVSLPDGFASSGEKYLKLSTEDGTLFRNVTTEGTAQTIPGTGLYVDTVVQFTVTDPTDRPTPDAADKFIVWLEPGTGETASETNVCVYAAGYEWLDDGSPTRVTNKVYKLTGDYGDNGTIASGSWHRLTVMAIRNAYNGSLSGVSIPGFRIYIDGKLAQSIDTHIYDLSHNESPQNFQNAASDFIDGAVSDGTTPTTFFPSMIDGATLTKVGFSGEGKVDDIVITETMPDIEDMNPVEFQIAWDTSVISSIKAEVGGQRKTFTSSPAVFRNESGYTVSIIKEDTVFADGSQAGLHKFQTWSSTTSNTAVDYAADGETPATDLSQAEIRTITVQGGEIYTLAFDSNIPTRTVHLDFNDAFDGNDILITSIACTVDGTTTTFNDQSEDWENLLVNLPVLAGKTVTIAVTYMSGYEGTMALADGTTGATLSNGTLTLAANDATDVTVVLDASAIQVVNKFRVGNTDYTLAEVLAGIADGSLTTSAANPLELTDAVTLEAAMEIPANYTLYIDLNGHTLTGAASEDVFEVTGSLYITDSSANAGTLSGGQVIAGTDGAVATVYTYGQLTIYNGYFTGAIASADGATDTAIAISGGSYSANVAEAVFPSAGYGLVYSELTSRWDYGALQLLIQYNANGGSGETMAATEFTVARDVQLSSNSYTKVDNTFQGWALAADGAVEYADGATIVAGSVTSNLTLYAVWQEDSGSEVEPGTTTGGFASQAEAEAATNNMTIVAANDVESELSPEQLNSYVGNFELVVKQVGENEWGVEVALTDSATNSLAQQVNADVATVATKLADVAAWTSGADVTVSVAATPGFYYSIAAGSTLANIAEVTGDRTLATGDTVTLALPKQSTAGFYKVLVNIVQKPIGPLNP